MPTFSSSPYPMKAMWQLDDLKASLCDSTVCSARLNSSGESTNRVQSRPTASCRWPWEKASRLRPSITKYEIGWGSLRNQIKIRNSLQKMTFFFCKSRTLAENIWLRKEYRGMERQAMFGLKMTRNPSRAFLDTIQPRL